MAAPRNGEGSSQQRQEGSSRQRYPPRPMTSVSSFEQPESGASGACPSSRNQSNLGPGCLLERAERIRPCELLPRSVLGRLPPTHRTGFELLEQAEPARAREITHN